MNYTILLSHLAMLNNVVLFTSAIFHTLEMILNILYVKGQQVIQEYRNYPKNLDTPKTAVIIPAFEQYGSPI